eukprot:gene12604-26531_t
MELSDPLEKGVSPKKQKRSNFFRRNMKKPYSPLTNNNVDDEIKEEKNSKEESEEDEEDWYTMQECPISANLVCPLVAAISRQDEEETIARINHKANKLYSQSKYSDAEVLFRLGKDIAERTYGSDHSDVIKAYDNIGRCCIAQGKYKEARQNYTTSMEWAQKLINTGNPKGPCLLVNAHVGMASVYLNMSNIKESEKHCVIATALAKSHFKDTDIKTVEPLEITAALYDRQGKYQESVVFYKN